MRQSLLFLLLLVLASNAPAQTFMRAYGIPGTTFDPPQSFLFSFGATTTADGYIFTEVQGLACFTDADGAVQDCKQMQAASPVGLLQLRQIERALGGSGYFCFANKTDTAIVLRTDDDLNILWQRATVFDGMQLNEQVLPLANDECVLGHSRSQGLNYRPVLSRFDAAGGVGWQRTYRSGASFAGNLTFDGLAATADDGLLAAGRYNPGAPQRPVVVRLDPDGIVLWAKEIAPTNGGNAFAQAVVELPNGQIRVAVADAAPDARLAIITLNASGDLVSAWGYQGLSGTPFGLRFLSDGTLTGTVVNTGTAYRIASDGSVVFAQAYSGLAGTSMLGRKLLPTADGGQIFHGNSTIGFFTDMTPVLYKTGPLGVLPAPYGTPATLTPIAYVPTVSSGNVVDSLVSSVHSPDLSFVPATALNDTLLGVPNTIGEVTAKASLQVWPNPATDRLTIDGPVRSGEITIMDGAGRIVRTTGRTALPHAMDIGPMAPGDYSIVVRDAESTFGARFVKK